MAREALSNGDKILSENYLQHSEHFSRILISQENLRNIATASSLQIRKKVYQNSSQQWKKYEPFLNGAFDSLLAPSVGKQPQD